MSIKNIKTKALTITFIITTLILVTEVIYFFYQKYQPSIILQSQSQPSPKTCPKPTFSPTPSLNSAWSSLIKESSKFISQKSHFDFVIQGKILALDFAKDNSPLPYNHKFKLTLLVPPNSDPLKIFYPQSDIDLFEIFKLSKSQEQIPIQLENLKVGDKLELHHIYGAQEPSKIKKIQFIVQP